MDRYASRGEPTRLLRGREQKPTLSYLEPEWIRDGTQVLFTRSFYDGRRAVFDLCFTDAVTSLHENCLTNAHGTKNYGYSQADVAR